MFKGALLTFITLSIIAKLFFSSLLAMFGYAAVPLQILSQLNHSKQIVDKVKARHKAKKRNTTKRFIKKTGKKVAATAVSAATIGTVAVIGTLTYLEITQYCDDQRELMVDENLLYDTELSFDYSACLTEAKKDSNAIVSEAWLSVKQTGDALLNDLEQSSDELLDPSRKVMAELFESIARWYDNN